MVGVNPVPVEVIHTVTRPFGAFFERTVTMVRFLMTFTFFLVRLGLIFTVIRADWPGPTVTFLTSRIFALRGIGRLALRAFTVRVAGVGFVAGSGSIGSPKTT